MVVCAVILAVSALHVAREFFIPIALALLFRALLRPVVRTLEAVHVPAPLGAALVVIGGLSVLGVGGWALSGPVQARAAKAPASLAVAQSKLWKLRRPFQQLTEATSGEAAGQPRPRQPATAATPDPTPAFIAGVLGTTTTFLGALVEVVLLVYLLLAAGDLFLRKLVRVLPARDDKRTAVEVVYAAESIVSHYLVLTALINVGQGLAVAAVVWALGMPDPLMWGLLTAVLEFVPYLGSAVMVGLLSITAITVFDSLSHALLVPGSYLLITGLQNNVLTPVAFGGRLKLNPVAVMIGVLFWWFLWGMPGAFLAIPITATLKALSDQVPRLAPLGEFLGA
jgi:predicted PurR-regulated permease PerM